MNRLDIGAIRAQVRALDYVRGTPAEVAMWREGDAEARANLAIEGMDLDADEHRSEEHTSELQSLMHISYAVFCLKKKITNLVQRCLNLHTEHNHAQIHMSKRL